MGVKRTLNSWMLGNLLVRPEDWEIEYPSRLSVIELLSKACLTDLIIVPP